MADAQRLDPALLPEGQRDEVAELDDLLLAEVLSQIGPDRVVGALGIPDQRARVAQRRLLARVVMVGALELQQLVVVLLPQPLLSARERPLAPSVVAFDRL